jgi:hypothetical protein
MVSLIYFSCWQHLSMCDFLCIILFSITATKHYLMLFKNHFSLTVGSIVKPSGSSISSFVSYILEYKLHMRYILVILI